MAKFRRWITEMPYLRNISVGRDTFGGCNPEQSLVELHTFCDASQDGVSSCSRSVQIVMAKSRLAPLKRPTIPRMELLACVIGARLSNFVTDAVNSFQIPSFLWSDSTTALSWIKGNDEWGTFVGNRVKEIYSLTKPEDWRHVPGASNPAEAVRLSSCLNPDGGRDRHGCTISQNTGQLKN